MPASVGAEQFLIQDCQARHSYLPPTATNGRQLSSPGIKESAGFWCLVVFHSRLPLRLPLTPSHPTPSPFPFAPSAQQDCNIYVCDQTSTVTIEECKGCRIFVSPIQSRCAALRRLQYFSASCLQSWPHTYPVVECPVVSTVPITCDSIFLRNCSDCRLVVACQQFRTRDCSNLDVAIYCQTLPIIEATSDIRFTCFRGSFFGLEGRCDYGLVGCRGQHSSAKQAGRQTLMAREIGG